MDKVTAKERPMDRRAQGWQSCKEQLVPSLKQREQIIGQTAHRPCFHTAEFTDVDRGWHSSAGGCGCLTACFSII